MKYGMQLIVLACAIALAGGCASSKNHKQASAKYKAESERPSSTTQPSGESKDSSASATTSTPKIDPSAVNNPFNGEWQLAIPRRHQQSASIIATDATHVTLKAGKFLSGEYVVQGNYLLILTRDDRMRSMAWKINSPDSLTLVRSPDFGNGRYPYTGVSLLRAPDESSTEADMDEVLP